MSRPFKPHGTWSEYVKGCRCKLCTLGARNYQRDYRKRNREKYSEYQRQYYVKKKAAQVMKPGLQSEQTTTSIRKEMKEDVN